MAEWRGPHTEGGRGRSGDKEESMALLPQRVQNERMRQFFQSPPHPPKAVPVLDAASTNTTILKLRTNVEGAVELFGQV